MPGKEPGAGSRISLEQEIGEGGAGNRYNAQESEVGLGDKSLEGVRAGISALRNHIAGDCIQLISGIFPHLAPGGWLCLQLDREQDGFAGSHSGFHEFLASR